MKQSRKENGMGQKKKDLTVYDMRPSLDPEVRESQCIELAMERAQQSLVDGTASSQVITHFLKLGSEKERLEREKLENEVELLRAKTKSYEDAKDMKRLFTDAISAMKEYSGHSE